jgi:hypothetical protein
MASHRSAWADINAFARLVIISRSTSGDTDAEVNSVTSFAGSTLWDEAVAVAPS